VVVVVNVAGTTTAGEIHYFDAFMLEQSSTVNPYYEDQGWIGNNVTLSTNTTKYLYGPSSLALTAKATSNTWVYGDTIPVTVGKSYTLSAYVLSDTTTRNMYVQITWYDSSATPISYPQSSQIGSSATKWTRISVTSIAPAGAVGAVCSVVVMPPGLDEVHYVDGVKFENSAIATQFIESRDQGQENKKVNIALSPLPIPHITGMQLNADIMLNDIVFNTIDENNVVWVCTDIDGWWNLPDSEVPDLTRGLDDGSYDVRGRYSARNLTFTGSLLCPDPASAAVARDKLIKAIDLIHKGGWLLVSENPTKAAFVSLSGRPDVTNTKARGRIDFSIGLRAANPIKYEWNWDDSDGYETTTVANGSSATLTNDGNTNVPIVFTLAGGASANLTAPITVNNTTLDQTLTVVKTLRSAAYSVNITRSERTGNVVTLTTAGHSYYVGDIVSVANVSTSGRTGLNEVARTITDVTANTITYTSANSGTLADLSTNGDIGLDSADTLEVDCYNKTALFNGSAFYNGGTISARSFIDPLVDWIVLAPGNNTITFTDSGGTTSLPVKYRSGWIG
jgi:hypothetical protein